MLNVKSFRIYLYIVILFIVFLILVVPGLRNECVPNKKISELSFYSLSEPSRDILIEKMNRFKMEHRNFVQKNLYKDFLEQFLPPEGYVEEMEKEESAIIDNKNIYISKNKMRWLSNNLMSPSVWDEQNVLRVLYQFKPEMLDFNPHYFRYGGSWLYPVSLSLFIASKVGIIKLVKDISYYIYHPENILLISIIGKSFGIFCYLLAIFIMFLVVRRFFNPRIFIIASFFMVFCPVVLVETVYLKPLLTSLMWYMVGIYFIFSILESKNTTLKSSIYAGLCAGLAAGSLLPSASILLPIFIALTYKRIFPLRGIKERIFKAPFNDIKYFFLSFLSFLIAFFVTNPYVLVSYKEFLREINWNTKDYLSSYSFWNHNIHFQNIIILFNGLGWLFGLWTIIALGWAIFIHRDKKNKIILFSILGYYMIAFSTCYAIFTLHALIPIVPLFILLSARFIDFLIQREKKIRFIIHILISVIATHSLLYSVFYVLKLHTKPRMMSGEWINKNIPRGSTIGSFIDNCGLSLNYPYFSYFHYRFINDSDPKMFKIKKELPQYYIIVHGYAPRIFTSPMNDIPKEYIDYLDQNTRGTHFRWFLKLQEEKEIEPYYSKIAEFNSKLGWFDKFFNNNLIYWWTKEIKIYKKKSNDAE